MAVWYLPHTLVAAATNLKGVDNFNPQPQVDFCKQSGAGEATGKQASGGGRMCSSTPQGLLPDVKKMVSTMISEPKAGSTVDAAKGFTVKFQTINFNSGFAANPDTEYLMAPQTLDDNGFIMGTQQLSIQFLGGANRAPNAKSVDFFQIVNTKTSGKGDFSVNVPAGALKQKGTYRICTMAASATFQPVVMPVAQRGAQDDCVRVQVN
ncbi:hypothetical protein EDD86DRAFT_272237 [Gorgonomyces haynaldii]|nr:hypothetical protein EDD86DRAFT_272237 [Gorgonomyces haynaldii]